MTPIPPQPRAQPDPPRASDPNGRPDAAPAPAEVAAEPGMARAPVGERLPRDELNTLAEDFGLDSTRYDSRGQVLEALSRRKQLIAALDRPAMLEVVRWGRRPVAANASKEQLALEIARIRGMRFDGLSDEGLRALARLRGVKCSKADERALVLRKLRRKEGVFGQLNRKRRSLVAALAAKVVGEEDADAPYRFLPAEPSDDPASAANPPPPMSPRLRHEIEDRGLFGGLADRVRRSADTYVNAKLDEIEVRIDRKLDEIDKRLAEWRDKEIANRVRILKITLWASVIVSIVSLIYAYVTRQVF